jgi:ribose transport system ATP-binding protein
VARSSLVLAEEPTAGVDVGARAEIYRILRDVSNDGTPVVIVSSDVHELEGLCDRVLVFSRGHVVGEPTGDRVTETEIGRIMVTATAHRRGRDRTRAHPGAGAAGWRSRLKSFGAGDYVSSVVLAILVFAIAAYVSANNIRFISFFNIQKILFLCSALAFVGFGQMCAVLTGGIDLSVGPLIGLCVVIASFFFGDIGAVSAMALGGLAMVGAGALVGLANGSLVRFGNFTSVAATLGVYVMIQGVSVLLRPFPAGSIDSDVIAVIQTNLFGIPAPFVVVVVLAALLELALHRTRWGLSIRAVGSNEISAAKIGIRTSWVVLGAFLASSLLTVLGGVMVMAQLGIGDPNQGVEYTLGSVAAVVSGGASLFGGRGSFLGVLFGALLIQEVNSATTFLGLSQAWQYWFVGLLTLCAVAAYSQGRRFSEDEAR